MSVSVGETPETDSGGGGRKSYIRSLFPPVTRNSLSGHYVPLIGGISHGSFAVHMLNPNALSNLVSNYDLAIANALFFNSHIGTAIYLYYRPHMVKVANRTRIIYSVYTAVLFNFGSVLLWATVKGILPKNVIVRGLFGAFTSFCLIAVGKEYLSYVDSMVSEENIE